MSSTILTAAAETPAPASKFTSSTTVIPPRNVVPAAKTTPFVKDTVHKPALMAAGADLSFEDLI